MGLKMSSNDKKLELTKSEQTLLVGIFMMPILALFIIKFIVWPQFVNQEMKSSEVQVRKSYDELVNLHSLVKNHLEKNDLETALTLLKDENIEFNYSNGLSLPNIKFLHYSKLAYFDDFQNLDDDFRNKSKELKTIYTELLEVRALDSKTIKNWHYISRKDLRKNKYDRLFYKSPKDNKKRSFLAHEPPFKETWNPIIRSALLKKLKGLNSGRTIASEAK